MLDRSITRPVLPEISGQSAERLRSLIKAESEADIGPEALRRLSALLPGDAAVAERVAVRLRLSTRARKRLACSAMSDLDINARALAYYVGTECAIDRLLLAGQSSAAADLSLWDAPRLQIGGGELIRRGLQPGPIVARTLRTIERNWVEAGFPDGDGLDQIISQALASVTK
jgi:poly(A) polymerase